MKKSILLSLVSSLLLGGSVVQASEAAPVDPNAPAEAGNQANVEANQAASSPQAAFDAAVKAFQETYSEAVITEVEVEILGDQSFEVDIDGYDASNEIEVKYLSREGVLVEDEYEDDEDDSDAPIDFANVITLTEATDLAAAQAGGGQAHHWKLSVDDDYGVAVWEIEFGEVEVDVDAVSGAILEIDS